MSSLPTADIHCPYCGEIITVFIDDSAGDQRYIEDCQVCCRPIVIDVALDEDGSPRISARSEDET
ncbi:CPXCG motif-containing cysteine-rich protein [Pseudoxanthomonas sp. UTMC 1351]|uniref:CPXCG motif-containing cysteine-rich protein n=1 Tax=Pseudoxanthomonas sp. UTMC 1351 TaxID=2695853 RepID=UPI0034CDE826